MVNEKEEKIVTENKNLKWYAVHAHSGQERKVGEALKARILQNGLQDKFGEILVPIKITNLAGGKQQKRVLMPGYVLVQMELSDEAMQLVVGTPKIIGFVGGSVGPNRYPPPMREAEINHLKSGAESSAIMPDIFFEIGESVKVIEGPFANFNGTVESIEPEKFKLKVNVSIFGRATPVELDYTQVAKAT